jgi:phosphate transport system substrate-binding protein
MSAFRIMKALVLMLGLVGAGTLTGAGATFPYPLYSKWVFEYAKAHPDTKINYQSIGSGGGIRQITERTVDFGASDAPMTAEQLSKLQSPILHIPTTLGAVVLTYNLPGVSGDLSFTSETIAGIYTGAIKKWNDPKLVAENPKAKLPDLDIAVVHRSDGSGTSFVFTDYLTRTAPAWKSIGASTSVKWPVGIGQKGNEGVTGFVKQTPGAIGYVELVYAAQNKLPVARIKNRAGAFVTASPASIAAAAAAEAAKLPTDMRVSIVDAEGKDSYPISSYTYVLLYEAQQDAARGKQLVDFLWWATHSGQSFCEPLGYAKLPPSVVKRVEQMLRRVTAAGKPIMAAG